MRMSTPKRGRRAVKRLDLTDMRHLFRDTRQWIAIGRVVVPAGETTHFANTGDDILIEVVLQPTLHDVTCRLAAGLWQVPQIGEEVVVVLPEGEMAFMPTVIGTLSTGVVPTGQEPTPTRIVIVRPEVLVHDGSGGAAALAMLSSLQATVDKLNALVNKYIIHTHSGGTLGGGLTGVPSDAVVSTADDAVGTTVLKGK